MRTTRPFVSASSSSSSLSAVPLSSERSCSAVLERVLDMAEIKLEKDACASALCSSSFSSNSTRETGFVGAADERVCACAAKPGPRVGARSVFAVAGQRLLLLFVSGGLKCRDQSAVGVGRVTSTSITGVGTLEDVA